MSTIVMEILAILAIILVIFTRTARFRGKFGESQVASLLRRLPTEQYKVINNVTLRKSNSKTTQIDHIVASERGHVIVIETKNIRSVVSGHYKDEYWTQHFRRSHYRFRNPLHQNYGHIKTLHEMFPELHDSAFHSVVVFTNDANLRNVTSGDGYVVNMRDLLPCIRELSGNMVDTKMSASKIYDKITSAAITERGTARRHVQQVRQDKRERRRNVSEGICPRCGSALKRRKGKYGDFLGCSSYPSCRFTAELH